MKKQFFKPGIEYQILIYKDQKLITEFYNSYLNSFNDILNILNYEIDYFYNNKILTFEITNLKTLQSLYKRKVIRLK